jgi:hypothetical protein
LATTKARWRYISPASCINARLFLAALRFFSLSLAPCGRLYPSRTDIRRPWRIAFNEFAAQFHFVAHAGGLTGSSRHTFPQQSVRILDAYRLHGSPQRLCGIALKGSASYSAFIAGPSVCKSPRKPTMITPTTARLISFAAALLITFTTVQSMASYGLPPAADTVSAGTVVASTVVASASLSR